MASTQVEHQPQSAGKIKAHNLHLLTGDDDGGPGSGYPPPGEQRQRLHSTGSHSSEDSRRMDQSPTGNQSDDSLEAEIQYQEDLKERLRKSFADLGIEAEGVLKDSLDDGDEDDALRDSLDDYDPNQANPPPQPLQRDGTFVSPQKGRPLDDSDDLGLQDSLDASQQETVEPNSHGFDNTIDNHMLTYPPNNGVDRVGSHPNSNTGSGRNSKDDSPNSVSSTHKDSPESKRKPPSGLSNGKARSAVGSRKRSGHPSRRGSAGSIRQKSSASVAGNKKSNSAGNSPASRPRLPHRTSIITRLDDGDPVRVEYISDDSGDDDLHYVNETGSPIIFASDAPKREDSELRRQFRIKIKPAPPKKPSPREQQAVNARRVSSGTIKSRQSSTDSAAAAELNNEVPQQEPVINKSDAQPLGVQESTLPPAQRMDSGNRNEPPGDQPALFGDVRVSTDDAHQVHAQQDDGHALRLDMQAVKQAAAAQEAALRFPNYSASKDRRQGPHSNNSAGANAAEQQNGHSNVQPQYGGRRDSERTEGNGYNGNPHSGYSQRNAPQSWQGSANPAARQQQVHADRPHPQGNQYDVRSPPQQLPPPLRTQEQNHQQSFERIPPNFPPQSSADNAPYQGVNYQTSFNQQPRFDPNVAASFHQQQQLQTSFQQQQQQQPVQTSFHPTQPFQADPRLSQSYQQQPPQWQQDYPPSSQGFPQQPPPPPPQQQSFYGQQAPQHFDNQGSSYQQGYQQQQQQQQQQQFHDQYPPQRQTPSAPPTDYADISMQGNGPFPVQQQQPHPQSAAVYQQQQGYPPPAQHQGSYQRPIQSEPSNQQQQHARNPPPPVRNGPDFIDRNKQYLRYGAPKRTYQGMYTVKKPSPVMDGVMSPPLNPHQPLPSISRENSLQDSWSQADDDEKWTKQLVEEQRHISALLRGQTDSNIRGFPQPQQGGSGLPQVGHGQSRWSADNATAYQRMQLSHEQQDMSARTYRVGDEMYNSVGSEDLPMMRGGKRTSPYPTLGAISSDRNGKIWNEICCCSVLSHLYFFMPP